MPVRVLCVGNMYPPHHLGGYELVWQGAVRHLRDTGHDVRMLTTRHRQPGVEAPDEPDVYRELRWYWRDHEFPRLRPAERLRLERHNAAVFDRHVETWHPDVVTWWAMGGMSLSLLARPRRHGVPAAAFVHDDWLLYGPAVDQWLRMFGHRGCRPLSALAERTFGIPTRLDVDAVSRWAFVSAFIRDRAVAAGHRLTGVSVVHSGIDESFIGPGPERRWEWRLLFLGRIDERKGADTAIAALRHLPAGATLTVVGEGDDRHLAELRQQAEALGGRVRLEGARARSEVPALIDAHDAVVFPARWDEPWGLVPLEAMARGRPVVSTARGGSREYLRPESNCVEFDADDAEGLAAALRRLAGDQQLRTRLRERGLETARRHTDALFHAGVANVVTETASGRRAATA
jgi:glycosyltransferase involved in cell wall biosynthesis